MAMHTIYLGADHRGYARKNELRELLKNCHPGMVEVVDLSEQEPEGLDDYNDCAIAVGKKIQNDESAVGVLLCSSAHGVTMQANRMKGIRAVNVASERSAEKARIEDWANIACMSAEDLTVDEMEKIIKVFCHTRYGQEERYARRARRLDEGEWLCQ